MSKRYQVFVSSTFLDLKEARAAVIHALMEMDCIPAGMELFPAMDEEQLNFIKSIIDDCDYYILLIGNRYGSEAHNGISFTESEYDYAVAQGMKVLAFVHGNPGEIPFDRSDADPEKQRKLLDFRTKVMNGRMVKQWTDPKELPGLVALSLQKTIRTYPAVGWIRGNVATTEESLNEINALRKEVETLRQQSKVIDIAASFLDLHLAPVTDTYLCTIYWGVRATLSEMAQSSAKTHEEVQIPWTWADYFSAIAPRLVTGPSDAVVNNVLAQALYCYITSSGVAPRDAAVAQSDFDIIRVQLHALGWTEWRYQPDSNGSSVLHWHLTEKGRKAMFEYCAVTT